jgi:hypothetical protein
MFTRLKCGRLDRLGTGGEGGTLTLEELLIEGTELGKRIVSHNR